MNDSIYDNLKTLARASSKFCVGMEGNISGKITDTNFLIKASGSILSNLNDDDLIEFDLNGTKISKTKRKPSMELGFHSYLLKFKGVNFVSHTHPVNTLKVMCSRRAIEFSVNRLFPDQVIFNGSKSCFVPYVMPGDKLTDMVKQSVETFISLEECLPSIILLENHGVITFGSTVEECVISTEICEKSAEIFVGLEKPKFLTLEEINEIQNDNKEKYRKSLLK